MARLTDPFEIIRRQGAPKEEFDLDQVIDLYDGCVAEFDHEVGKMLAHLQDCGLTDNTIVVVYSDHGMEFFEHNTWGQGNSATSDVSSRIPLLIRIPGMGHGHHVTQPVRSIDLAPTLLELAGIERAQAMDGVSLNAYVQTPGSQPDRDIFSETGIWLTDLPGTPDGHMRYPNLLDLLTVRDIATGTISLKPELEDIVVRAKDRMVRRGHWKLVYHPLDSGYLLKLFNLEEDPDCAADVSAHHPERVAEMWVLLEAWMHGEPCMTHEEN
jgi:arylsulfatase A-like enzyme